LKSVSVEDDKVYDADSIVSEWKAASTHRERAMAENSLRKHMKVPSADLSIILEGAKNLEVRNRTQFFLSGSEYVWKILDEEKVKMATAVRLLREATRISKALGRPLDDVLKERFLESQRRAGPRSGPRPSSSSSNGWDLVRETLSSIIRKELDGLLDVEKSALMAEAMVEVDVLVRHLRSKIRSKTKSGLPKDWEAGLEKAERKEFCSDMRELGLDPPKPGRMPDMAQVKNSYRRVAADHHPDRRQDSGAKEKFRRVNESYQRILAYVESKKETLR
jgi:hypothetical protein